MTTIIRHTHCVLHSHLAVTHPSEGDEREGGEGSNVDGVGGEAGHRPEGGGVGGRVAH